MDAADRGRVGCRRLLPTIARDGLKDIFGKEISRYLIGRVHARGLIGTAPRRALHLRDHRSVPRGVRSGGAPGSAGSGVSSRCQT